jgi:hypothetical protein
VVLGAEWGVGQVLWSLIWIFLFVVWIMLLLRVFADIFRSDMSAVAKVLWTIFVIVFPFLGVFAYVLVRGDRMLAHEMRERVRREEQMREYIRGVAGADGGASANGAAGELERLANLRDRGVIDDDEFARLKAKVVAAA